MHVTKNIFSIGGPCGVGKDTIVKAILERHSGAVVRFPRTTTRKPRLEEAGGHAYRFMDRQAFNHYRGANRICCVDDAGTALYGIDLVELRGTCGNGCPDRIIIVGGICGIELKQVIQPVTTVYITASYEEIVERITARGHSAKELARRLEWIKRQLRDEPQHFDHVVENPKDHIDDAIAQVLSIMKL